MGRYRLVGFAFILAYQACYLLLWARVSRLRRSSANPSALPTTSSLFLGSAALEYVWSGRYRQANDPRLSQLVLVIRISQFLAALGVILILTG
jgi:hypothetical protein